jgi:hypothetical protein
MKTRKAVTRTLILWIAVALVLSTTGFSAHQAGPLPADVRTSPDGKGYRFDQNGWLYVHIEGQPRERGFQHGYLVAPELKEILRVVKFMVYEETGMKWEFFVDAAEELFAGRIEQEYLDEIRGIAEGAKAAGTDISWQEVLTWNGYEELTDYWWPNQAAKWYGSYSPKDNEHCSAFIATGSYTKDGKVVVAHNSWNDYVVGVFANAILDVQPDKGHRIFMQSEPGFIASFTDFFVTDAGIMGTETTIGGYGQFDPNAAPEFARARQAMQYADNLDQFVAIMRKNNNGGYANSWLLADRNTGEIMRFELGLKFFNVERTKDGYFVGFNAAQDPRIRNLESSYAGYDDIRYPTGARRVRLTQLMERYKGQINVEIAEKILGDGFDVYLNKYNPSSRTVEGRYELDDRAVVTIPGRPPFQPRGALDGKVMDSDLAKALSLWARWGSSSGLAFDADEFLERHIQWSHLKGYLKSRPTQPWTLFAAGQKPAATAVSSSAPQALTLPAPAGKTPLKDALPNLEPKAVWENFYALTQIPRPSHHEEKVSAFLADFGKKLGLETTVDEVGNVLIRKPATKGMENRQGVILQAHIDMVPQKTPDKTHDFEKDPIQAYVEGSWVKADHTTLGADDGIGVAIIMAILQAKDLTVESTHILTFAPGWFRVASGNLINIIS